MRCGLPRRHVLGRSAPAARWLALFALGVAMGSASCRAGGVAGGSASPEAPVAAAAAERAPVVFTFEPLVPRGAVVPEEALRQQHPEAVPGEACADDRGCRSPLRCLHDRCAFPLAMTGAVETDTPRVAFVDAPDPAIFFLELAVAPHEQARGLMHRRSMAEDHGMLFWYPADQELVFWMDQTLLPLDILFVNGEGRIVHIEREAEPLTRSPRASREPARFVIELKGGVAAQRGIRTGQRVVFDGVEAVVGRP